MKTAKLVALSVGVNCPHCGEPKAGSDGSCQWDANALEKARGQVLECYNCDKPFVMPLLGKAHRAQIL